MWVGLQMTQESGRLRIDGREFRRGRLIDEEVDGVAGLQFDHASRIFAGVIVDYFLNFRCIVLSINCETRKP